MSEIDWDAVREHFAAMDTQAFHQIARDGDVYGRQAGTLLELTLRRASGSVVSVCLDADQAAFVAENLLSAALLVKRERDLGESQ